MDMQMQTWLTSLLTAAEKPAIPVLSFPCVSLMGISVEDLVTDGEMQARGMQLVAGRVKSGASVSMMDLSVEAEAFGAKVRMEKMEVPTVTDALVHTQQEADALQVPKVGAGRTGIYVGAMEKSAALIQDRPVFAGMIGPFSLAGRLLGVSDALADCYDEPELLECVLEKATQFLMEYAAAYKAVHVSGLVMAEPLTGLLSASLAERFSEPYVKRIIAAVQDANFLVIYHNCGNNTVGMTDSLVRTGASAFHFGNSVDMGEVLSKMPADVLVMGNLDPAGQLRNGTVESVTQATRTLMERCAEYKNFVPSTGCDVPPATPWENIDAFFAGVEAYYAERAARTR